MPWVSGSSVGSGLSLTFNIPPNLQIYIELLSLRNPLENEVFQLNECIFQIDEVAPLKVVKLVFKHLQFYFKIYCQCSSLSP